MKYKSLYNIEHGGLYKQSLFRFEQQLLKKVLEENNLNQNKVASILGISRNTLRRKLKVHGLEDLHQSVGYNKRI